MNLLVGDCVEVMAEMPADSVDAIVTDPPYGLEFMGKEWDRLDTRQPDDPTFHRSGVGPFDRAKVRHSSAASYGGNAGRGMQAFHERWAREAFRVLKPGGHLVAFGGTRTSHRMVCAIEDAGFEIRDRILHIRGDDGRRIPACECGGLAVPYTHNAGREEIPEHDVRPMRDADIPTPESAPEVRGEVLQPGMPEQGTPEQGTTRPESESGRTEQPGMEGRGNVQAEQGQLHRPEVRQVSGGVSADGSQGRVHHGASSSDGETSGAAPEPDGGSPPQGSQHAEQQHREPTAIQDEWRTQTCGRCGKALPSLRGGDAIESMPADLAWVYGSG